MREHTFLLRLLLQSLHLLFRLSARLVRRVRHLNNLRHFVFFRLKLCFEAAVYAIKDDSLASQVLDALPQLAVVGPGLVELM